MDAVSASAVGPFLNFQIDRTALARQVLADAGAEGFGSANDGELSIVEGTEVVATPQRPPSSPPPPNVVLDGRFRLNSPERALVIAREGELAFFGSNELIEGSKTIRGCGKEGGNLNCPPKKARTFS